MDINTFDNVETNTFLTNHRKEIDDLFNLLSTKGTPEELADMMIKHINEVNKDQIYMYYKLSSIMYRLSLALKNSCQVRFTLEALKEVTK